MGRKGYATEAERAEARKRAYRKYYRSAKGQAEHARKRESEARKAYIAGGGQKRADVKHRRSPQRKEWAWRRMGAQMPTRPMPYKCEACGIDVLITGKDHCLDHCHKTGRFRGWLCTNCNVGLGALGDTLANVNRIVAYLKRAGETDD